MRLHAAVVAILIALCRRRGLKARRTVWTSTTSPPAFRRTLRKEEWTYDAHLVVGLWHVDHYGSDEALVRLQSGIRRLNESFGGANTATGGYHETITAAYVTLLSQYVERRQHGESLRDLTTRLLAGPVAAKDVLFMFYSRELLMSVEARVAWVEPDLAPLDLSLVVIDKLVTRG